MYKRQHDLVSTMSTKGWNNVPDMTLSILYGKSGLKDIDVYKRQDYKTYIRQGDNMVTVNNSDY